MSRASTTQFEEHLPSDRTAGSFPRVHVDTVSIARRPDRWRIAHRDRRGHRSWGGCQRRWRRGACHWPRTTRPRWVTELALMLALGGGLPGRHRGAAGRAGGVRAANTARVHTVALHPTTPAAGNPDGSGSDRSPSGRPWPAPGDASCSPSPTRPLSRLGQHRSHPTTPRPTPTVANRRPPEATLRTLSHPRSRITHKRGSRRTRAASPTAGKFGLASPPDP